MTKKFDVTSTLPISLSIEDAATYAGVSIDEMRAWTNHASDPIPCLVSKTGRKRPLTSQIEHYVITRHGNEGCLKLRDAS